MKLLRDPMVHFLLLGGVLFALHAVTSDLFSQGSARRIEITGAEVDFLAAGFERQWGRPPGTEELQGMIDARLREEVFYREALLLGMDENDQVVRRRMAQKMEFLSQDLATLADPTEEELREFYRQKQDEYRVPSRLTFSQVYFNPESRGSNVEEDARKVLAELQSANTTPDRALERGDRLMLPHDFRQQTAMEVRREFGESFAESLFELAPGWQGPVVSAYGLHLVYVGDKVGSYIPGFEDLRGDLVDDFNRERRTRAKEMLFEGLLERYEVTIDEGAVRGATTDRTTKNASEGS